MKDKSFITETRVEKSPQEVFNCLTHVTKWWSKDFEGSSEKLNDEFTIHHPGQHFSKQKLVEIIPSRKIVWLVTESRLEWIQNKNEWTNTRMIFDIYGDGEKTTLHFTHEGLVPELECYSMCETGWNMIIKDWLFHYINSGNPSSEMEKAAEIRNKILIEKRTSNDTK